MELAAALHHSASQSARFETNDFLRSQKTVNSKEEAVIFELYDEHTAGWQPALLSEVAGPQERVLRHIVAQIGGGSGSAPACNVSEVAQRPTRTEPTEWTDSERLESPSMVLLFTWLAFMKESIFTIFGRKNIMLTNGRLRIFMEHRLRRNIEN